MASFPNVAVLNSRAVTALFSVIRDKSTPLERYVRHCDRLLTLLAEEGLAHLPAEEVTVQTPCGPCAGIRVTPPGQVCAVSIVRSGDILVEAVHRIVPEITVGKILIQRDENDPEKRAKLFYSKLPKDIAERQVLLCDPMLATGGSASCAIKVLLDAGVAETSILFLNCVSCPEGLERLRNEYPGVKVVTAAVDEKLNGEKFIVPGLGDFGDRYYGTE